MIGGIQKGGDDVLVPQACYAAMLLRHIHRGTPG